MRLTFQPNWPLQFQIGGISVADEQPNEGDPVINVVEGGHRDGDSLYAPAWAFATAQ